MIKYELETSEKSIMRMHASHQGHSEEPACTPAC